jgi:hypothetical protein
LHSAKSNHLARSTYKVYVVELSKRVFTENRRFREANPQFNGVLECLYVGMTSKTPAERFRQHKTGYINKKGYKISASIVEKYGMYLRPSLYDHINLKPMTRQQALLMEKKLALDLRRQGYAVWFN